MPTSILQSRSTFFMLYQKDPDYSFLRVVGCLCFPFMRPYNSNKLDPRSLPCTFLGYSPFHKRYKCLADSGKMYISRHVVFEETIFPFNKPIHTTNSNLSLSLLPKIPLLSFSKVDNNPPYSDNYSDPIDPSQQNTNSDPVDQSQSNSTNSSSSDQPPTLHIDFTQYVT